MMGSSICQGTVDSKAPERDKRTERRPNERGLRALVIVGSFGNDSRKSAWHMLTSNLCRRHVPTPYFTLTCLAAR